MPKRIVLSIIHLVGAVVLGFFASSVFLFPPQILVKIVAGE